MPGNNLYRLSDNFTANVKKRAESNYYLQNLLSSAESFGLVGVRALVHEKIPRLFFPIFFPFLRRKQVNSNNMTIHNCNTLVLKVPNYLINCHNVCFLLFSSKKRIKMGKKRRGIFSCTRALVKRKDFKASLGKMKTRNSWSKGTHCIKARKAKWKHVRHPYQAYTSGNQRINLHFFE